MTTRRKLLIGIAAVVGTGGAVWWAATRDEEPEPPWKELWSAELPPFGEIVAARVRSRTVLVVQERGLVAAANGTELWRRDTTEEVTAAFGGALGAATAPAYVRTVRDAFVLARYDERAPGPVGYEVADLTTGTARFTAGRADASGMEAVVTPELLVVHRWWDATGKRTLVAYDLADGAEKWGRGADPGVVFPSPTSTRHHRVDVPNMAPVSLDPVGDIALLTSSSLSGPAGNRSVTVVDLATGEDVGAWEIADDGNVDPTVIGSSIVDTGRSGVLTGHDRQSGKRLWSHEVRTYDRDSMRVVHGVHSARFIDGDRLIDLATGATDPFPDMEGRAVLAVNAGAFLTLGESDLAEISTRRRHWAFDLRPGGAPGEVLIDRFLLDGDRVLLGGRLGSEPALWDVDLVRGRWRSTSGAVLHAVEAGLIAAGTGNRLRVYEVSYEESDH